MQHGGDYGSYYGTQYPPPQNPNLPPPPPIEFPSPNPAQPSYASAPPFSDFPAYSAAPSAAASSAPPSYPPYAQNSEPVPNLPPPSVPYAQQQFPNFAAYNPTPYAPETSQAPPAPPYSHLQQPSPVPPPYYSFDQAPNYAPPVNSGANPSPLHNQSSSFTSSYPSYDAPPPPYGNSASGYFLDEQARYGVAHDRSRSGFDQDLYERKPDNGTQYGRYEPRNDGLGDGVYAYNGGRSEPYGARGTVPTRSQTLFDDYGRSLSTPSSGKDQGGSVGKIVRAVPKVDTQQDAKGGVQKYRVKLLPEGGGSSMDVLCQIGLDGIRMLDPSTNRTLRIYPLENVTRWDVTDSSTFTFWSKSSVDIDPRRIRLQSNSYTTNTILDTVTAASVQLKEIGGREALIRSKSSAETAKQPEQPGEKKKGLIDWMNLIKPANEEKDHWVPDEAVTKCTSCGSDFGAFNRRHHCRNCGDIFCDKCTQGRIALTADDNVPVRVCDRCMAEVSRRLNNAKEAASKTVGLHSHEDLARKLQEEMDRNRKSSSGLKSSDGSGRRMREVACPTCTVHLQVQVPASGSETIECGVCQHPFLVSAN